MEDIQDALCTVKRQSTLEDVIECLKKSFEVSPEAQAVDLSEAGLLADFHAESL